jgi:hypothetical protein
MMITLLPLVVGPFGMASSGDVDLAAYDRFNSPFACGLVETDNAKQIAMVGHSDSWHSQFLHSIHHAINGTGAVQQAVIRVKVQVNKLVAFHHFSSTEEGRKYE